MFCPAAATILLGMQKEGARTMEPKYPLDVDDLIYQDEWQISER